MKAEIVDEAIKWCLAEIHAKLKEAEQIARAAQACAQAGGIAEAIQILSSSSTRPEGFMMPRRSLLA